MLKNNRHNSRLLISMGLLSVFSFILSLSSFANKSTDKSPVFRKTIMLGGICQQMEIWGNIEIILSPELSDRIIVEGSAEDINTIKVNLKKGDLAVHAKWMKQIGKTKIFVPAAMLRFMQVDGNSEISSAGFLNVPRLKVVLNGETSVKIQSAGEVNVETGDGYYLTPGIVENKIHSAEPKP